MNHTPIRKLHAQNIRSLIYKSTLRNSLIPIFTIELVLLVLYFGINFYISQQNQNTLLKGAQVQVQEIASREVGNINAQLQEASRLAQMMRADHELFVRQPPQACVLPNGEPQFGVHKNGVYFKTVNNGGASLYYSSDTKMGPEERRKARCSEVMDPLLKSLVDTSPLVTQAYFNSWDNMNRLYPFMEDAPGQYGPILTMTDYNFYHEADAKHNPERKPVWTGAYLDPAGQGWMVSVIVPVYRGDFLEGVSGLDVTIDSFVQNVLGLKMPWDAATFMVDSHGMILALQPRAEQILGLRELKSHDYKDNVRETVEKPEDFNLLQRGHEATRAQMQRLFADETRMAMLNIEGVEYIVSQEIVPETGWRMMTLIEKNTVFAPITELKKISDRIGYLAIAVMLLFYLIFFVYVQRKSHKLAAQLSAPIENLSAITRDFVQKLKNPHIEPVQIEEIDDLGNNFSVMIRELEARTRAYLDAKIIAEEASRIKSLFLANMSHEIRTPLNGILGMAQLMVYDDTTNEERLEYAHILLESGNSLQVLLGDILTLANTESGQVVLDNHACEPAKVAQEVFDLLAPNAQLKGLALTVDCALEPGQVFWSDPLRLKQMLTNLVNNAIKFTAQGTIQVQVRALDEPGAADAGLCWVEFAVADTGIGVPADKQHLLFQPFTQVDESSTRAFGGSGLGLSLVRQFAELMGGRVGVESDPGRGSRFWFQVPLALHKPAH